MLIGGESPKLDLIYSAAAIDKAVISRRRIRIINIYNNRIGLRTYY